LLSISASDPSESQVSYNEEHNGDTFNEEYRHSQASCGISQVTNVTEFKAGAEFPEMPLHYTAFPACETLHFLFYLGHIQAGQKFFVSIIL